MSESSSTPSSDALRGLFITFEGGDGVGKTTQIELLEAALNRANRTVLRTREPGGTDIGLKIREIVLHATEPLGARAEALLYAADRAHHISSVVRPALQRGEVVLQDRYFDSSVAYQGSGRELDGVEIRELSMWASGALIPHLTVLLDLDVDMARTRMHTSRESLDRLESESTSFHERVRRAFLAQAEAEPNRFLVLDASAPRNELHAAILARVDTLAGAEQPHTPGSALTE